MRTKLLQSYILPLFCGGFLVGVILTFFAGFSLSIYLLLPAILVLILAIFRPSIFMLLLVFVAGAICGGLRAEAGTSKALDITFTKTIKQRLLYNIDSSMPDPESKLGTAYLLGEKSSLPTEVNDSLKTIGLAHIVVASGTHLSILIGFVRRVFQKISRNTTVVFSIIFITLFVAMLDCAPSILRAGIISILSLLAWYCGRKFSPIRIILVAILITLLINPAFLTELGWQMSFLSFAGVMIIGPVVTKFLFNKPPGLLARTIISTIAATSLTLPLTLYYFGSFSLLSPLANLLILPTLPFALGLTFFAGLTFGIPFLNSIFAFLSTKLLDYHLFVINFFADKNVFLITIEPGNPGVLLLYILILLILLAFLINRTLLYRHDFTFLGKDGKIKRSNNYLTGETNVRTQQVGHHQTSESRRRRKARRVVYKNWQPNCHRSAWRYRSKHEPFPCHGA